MPVYFIVECGNARKALKIGRATDIQKRRRNLQTGNPAELLIIGWIVAEDEVAFEHALHQRFQHQRRGGEWFEIEPADIQPILLRAGIRGFVAKNADAFEIIGYDRDGITEFVGIWDWGDLEYEECCPFCGCCCGIHYQEVSSLHHCLNCDTLTDFEEVMF
ncbi:hypothetical protein GCM10007881_61760 [Mesorhizobium huakuii]|uniref:GIY-YIG nuclease family protein n=1 Tax=Mesorhizobium huakuii TaxID=28104 RepID=UPI00235DBC6E|nr:GIY-YIG nuclease family protein [Mesorhizobium huakuii]GLQ82653.1 hypothetical protein GCM10007881_61760 [Mesorhizobium huakuii]